MREIFINELKRYWKWAAILAALQFMVMAYFGANGNIFYPAAGVGSLASYDGSIIAVFALAIIISMVFGLAQTSHKTSSGQWLQLTHRPLSMGSIFASVIGASGLLFLLGAIAPHLLMLLQAKFGHNLPVDDRSYAALFGLFALCMIGWFAGVTTIMSRSKWVGLIILPIFDMGSKLAAGNITYLYLAIFLAFYGWLAWGSWRRAQSTAEANPGYAVARALIVQSGVFMIFAYLVPLAFISGRTANFQEGLPDQTEVAYRLDRVDLQPYLLKSLPKDKQRILESQLAEVSNAFALDDTPRRHAVDRLNVAVPFSGKSAPRLFTPVQDRVYTYSYDTRQFVAVDQNRRTRYVGILGPKGYEPKGEISADNQFDVHPWDLRDTGDIIAGPELYMRSLADKITNVFTLLSGRMWRVANVARDLTKGDDTPARYQILVDDHEVHVIDLAGTNPGEKWAAGWSLPSQSNNGKASLGQYYLHTMKDGDLMLVRTLEQFRHPHQTTVYVDRLSAGGQITPILQHSFQPSQLMHVQDLTYWTISPLHFGLNWVVADLLNPQFDAATHLSGSVTPDIWLAMLIGAVVCAGAIYRLTLHMPLTPTMRTIWLVMGFVGGLPAVLSFLILNEWRPYWRSAPRLTTQASAI